MPRHKKRTAEVRKHQSYNSETGSDCNVAWLIIAILAGVAAILIAPYSLVDYVPAKPARNGEQSEGNLNEPDVVVPESKLSSAEVERVLRAAETVTAKGKPLERAIQALERILKKAPHSLVAEVHIELANKYDVLGEKGSVENHLRDAVRVSRNSAGEQHGYASYALASFLLRLGTATLRPQIIELLRSAVQRLPNHADSRHWLGHQLMRSAAASKEAEKVLAEVQLDKLSQSHPVDTIMLLAQARERLGKIEESAETFDQAYTLRQRLLAHGAEIPDRIQFRFGLSRFQYCRLLIIMGRFSEAVEASTLALREMPEVYHLYDVTAVALANLGRISDIAGVYTHYMEHIQGWPEDQKSMPLRVFGATLAMIRTEIMNTKPSTKWIDTRPQLLPKYIISENLNGGWPEHVNSKNLEGRCNIDRRSNLSKKEFFKEYVDKNHPVILQGLLDDWPATRTWQKDAFVKKYGDFNVTLRKSSHVAYDNEFGGLMGDVMTIRQYVESVIEAPIDDEDPPYVLSTSLRNISGLAQDYIPLSHFNDQRFGWSDKERHDAALMFFGKAGSGVTLHEHTNAWNALVYGRKHWILIPPYTQYGPTALSHLQWMESWHSKFAAKAYQCTQYAGEVLYVPTNWMHSLVNLQASIGIAVEVGLDSHLLAAGLHDMQKSK